MAKKPEKHFDYNNSEEGGGFPWSLVLAILGLLALIVLRRFLRLLFPMLFVLLVLVPLLWYMWCQFKYRDLGAIVTEYDGLVALLTELRLGSYLSVVNSSMKHLLLARDRAEKLQEYLNRESLLRQKERVKELEKQLSETKDPEKVVFLEKALKDTRETLTRLKKMQDFLGKYEDGKAVLAGHFKNTRMKLELEQMDLEGGISLASDEVNQVMDEIRSFDFMYDTVDRPGETDQRPIPPQKLSE